MEPLTTCTLCGTGISHFVLHCDDCDPEKTREKTRQSVEEIIKTLKEKAHQRIERGTSGPEVYCPVETIYQRVSLSH